MTQVKTTVRENMFGWKLFSGKYFFLVDIFIWYLSSAFDYISEQSRAKALDYWLVSILCWNPGMYRFHVLLVMVDW